MFYTPMGNESPGYYVPAADASTQTTEEDFILLEPHTTRDASTQTTEDDFNFLSRIQSIGNLSTLTSDSAVDNNETVHPGSQEYKNDCDMVSAQVKMVSASMGDSDVSQSSGGSNNNEDHNHVQNARMVPIHSWIRNESNDRVIMDRSESVKQMSTSISGVNNVSRCNGVIYNQLQILYNQVESAGLHAYAGSHITMATPPHSSHALTRAEISKKIIAESKNHAEPLVIDSQRNVYKCGKCGKRFVKESRLNAHVLSNCHPKPYKCDKCDGRFRDNYNLRGHNCVAIICEECHYSNNRRDKLNKHLYTKHNNYLCLKCGTWFNDKPAFYNHVLSNCDPNLFKCDKCGANLPVESRLRSPNT